MQGAYSMCMVSVHAYIWTNATEFCFSREKREKKSWIPKDKICILHLLSFPTPIFCTAFFSKYILHCSAWWSGPSSEMPQLVPLQPNLKYLSREPSTSQPTPQKSRCHVQSHHSSNRPCIQNTPALRGGTRFPSIVMSGLLRVQCRNGA